MAGAFTNIATTREMAKRLGVSFDRLKSLYHQNRVFQQGKHWHLFQGVLQWSIRSTQERYAEAFGKRKQPVPKPRRY